MLQKIGRLLILFFVGFLPWSVIVTVFGMERMDIQMMRFCKEALIGIIVIVALLDMWRKKYRMTFDILDGAILLYILTLLIVSFSTNTRAIGIVYGLRYDTEFLVVFILFRQMIRLWNVSFRELGRVFILSGAVMLCVSLLIRYVFGEVILTVFGFSGQVSVWDGSGPPPIYHGIPGAAVVRFQGMLEGPNQMAFFLLTYLGVYISLLFRYKKYRFINSVIIVLLLFLVTQTYSRSGLLWVALGSVILFCYAVIQKIRTPGFFNQRIAWGKISTTILVILIGGTLAVFQFGPKFTEIITRKWSTSAHFERMYIGYLRFLEQPLWHGLAQAGPASRSIAEVNHKIIPLTSLNPEMRHLSDLFLARNPDFVFSTEHYYIPESWYIQQLIEGWVIGFFFFVCIFMRLLFSLKRYPAMFVALAGVLVMNTFLHSFESMHTSLVLFIILASLVHRCDHSS